MATTRKFHVFLSHNTADKPDVEKLAHKLRAVGLEPWLDKWHLIPGDPWQPAIEQALAQCGSAAVIIGPNSLGPWQHEEMRVAIGLRVKSSRQADRRDHFRVIPILLPGLRRPDESTLPAFLAQTTWVEFDRSLDEPEQFHRLVCGVRGLSPEPASSEGLVEGECPYRGLEFFDVTHAKYFFGREDRVGWLLAALRRPLKEPENRFLAIVGASGSGKSSLARAGLVAALKRGELRGSTDWPVVICRPGANPVQSLALAMAELDPTWRADDVQKAMESMTAAENGLHLGLSLALRGAPDGRRAVLLVDQFEEVFTLCRDESHRKTAIDNLVYASTVAGGRTVVVLTLRADFVGKCAVYPALAAAVSGHQALVGPMTEDQLRRAIEKPALRAGCEPGPGLVDVLVQDVQGQAGGLPLLQFALRELWGQRDGRWLTLEAYRKMGELRGALNKRATEVLREFSDAEQEVCRRVFLRLTQPGEGTEDTKRRASYGELLSATTEIETVQKVVQHLADARLLTTEGNGQGNEGGSVEVAHEALIRNWDELRKWIDADRNGLRIHRRMTEAANEWHNNGRDPSFLYSGARLVVANEWVAKNDKDPSVLELEFLATSRTEESKRKADEQQSALEHAQAIAESRRRTNRVFQYALAVAGFLLLGTGVAALVAVQQRAVARSQKKDAETKRDEAETLKEAANTQRDIAKEQMKIGQSRALAALARADTRLDRTLNLAVLANKTCDTVEARGSLFHSIMSRPGLTAFVHSIDKWSLGTSISPDGRLAAVGKGPAVELWDVVSGQLDGILNLDLQAGRVFECAFNGNGKLIAASFDSTSGRQEGVIVWDVSSRRALTESPFNSNGTASNLTFSSDGNFLAYIDESGIIVCDLVARSVTTLPQGRGWRSALHFSPDGKTLISYSESTIEIWDVKSRKSREKIKVNLEWIGSIEAAAFHPAGTILALGLVDGRSIESGGSVVFWDIVARKELARHKVAEGRIMGLAYDQSGILAAGYGGVYGRGGVVLVDQCARRVGPALEIGEGYVRRLSVSNNGSGLAASFVGTDAVFPRGGVAVWDLRAWRRRSYRPHSVSNGGPYSLQFHPSGRILAVAIEGPVNNAEEDDRVPAADLPDIYVVGGESNFGYERRALAYSPDGKQLAVSGKDGVFFWNTVDPRVPSINPIPLTTKPTRGLAFDSTGTALATIEDKSVIVWDAATLRRTGSSKKVPVGHPTCVKFSPLRKVIAIGYSARSNQDFGPDTGGVILWDLVSGTTTDLSLGDGGAVNDVAYSPDGHLLVAGYGSDLETVGGVAWWDLTTKVRKPERPSGGSQGMVSSVAFSPDGTTLAAGYNQEFLGGSVIFWDVASRQTLVDRPFLVEGGVRSLGFRPDGGALAVGLYDSNKGGGGCVTIWDLIPAADRVSRARRIANRNLIAGEWEMAFPGKPHARTFDDLPLENERGQSIAERP